MKKSLIVGLVVAGIALVGIGIVYLVEPAKHLPSFFPGYARHAHQLHATRHGIVIFGLGILALLGAAVIVRRRSSSGYHPS